MIFARGKPRRSVMFQYRMRILLSACSAVSSWYSTAAYVEMHSEMYARGQPHCSWQTRRGCWLTLLVSANDASARMGEEVTCVMRAWVPFGD